MLLTGSEPAPN